MNSIAQFFAATLPSQSLIPSLYRSSIWRGSRAPSVCGPIQGGDPSSRGVAVNMYATENSDNYLEAVQDIGTKRYLAIAAELILVWEWVTHIDDEVNLIWMWGWSSLAKPLYLILRYGGIIANMFDAVSMLGVWDAKYCTIYLYTTSITTAVALYLVDLMLAYRAACLYPNQFRRLSAMNNVILSCAAIASVVMFSTNLPRANAIDTPEHLTGCWSERSVFTHGLIVPPLAFELWMFCLVGYKLYLTWSEHESVGAKSTFRLVVKDQVYWFFVITAVIVWASIHFTLVRPTLRTFPILYLRTLACICGCHLVLHIRRSYNSMNEQDEMTLATVLFKRPTTATQDLTIGGGVQTSILGVDAVGSRRGGGLASGAELATKEEPEVIEMSQFSERLSDLEKAQ